LALGGCGNLLSGLIPDAEVDNPLQFDGASIEVVFDGGATIRLQAIGGSGALDEAIPFGDDDLGPNALAPARLAIDGGFAGEAVLVADTYPDELVLDDIELSLRLWQGAETFDDAGSEDRLEPDPFDAGSSLTMAKVDSACNDRCLYAFVFPSVAGSSLQIELDGSDLDRALEIVRESPDANFVDVSLALTVASDPELGAGGSLTLTLDAVDGTLSF
jgi:hypothetical protein